MQHRNTPGVTIHPTQVWRHGYTIRTEDHPMTITTSICVPVLMATVLLSAVRAAAAEADFVKKTHVFKTAGDLKIQADVYRADDAKVRPCVVWIHGGALIVGNRMS